MRLLFILPAYFDPASYIGGGERYPINLARAVVEASDNDVQITIVSFGNKTRAFNLSKNIDMQILVTCYQDRPMFDATSAAIYDLVESYDVVHIFQPFTYGGEVASLASLNNGTPTVLTDLGCSTSHVGEQSGLVGLADALVCISAFSATRYKPYGNTIHAVARGPYDDQKFFLNNPQDSRRTSILFVGRIMPHKGIDVAVRALPPGLPMTICGRPYNEEYFSLLRLLAKDKDVTFVTDASDEQLIHLYRSSLAVVLPSVNFDIYGNYYPYPELLGLTLLEGAGCGCFAICSNVGGMPEFIGDFDCGTMFENEARLVEIFRDVADDPSRYSRASAVEKRARWARETHGLKATGQRIMKVYRDLSCRKNH